MKTIIYAGGELVTGDDIARAVLEYAEALAESTTAQTVDIPVLDSDGSRTTATILIGPASQIMTRAAHVPGAELDDPEALDRLRAATRALRPEGDEEHDRPHSSWSEDY